MSDSTFLVELQRRNILKVAAAYAVFSWIVLQIADILFPVFGLGDEHIGWALGFLIVFFPIALVAAWFYELTPKGLVPTRRVNPNESIAKETGQRINTIIIGLLSVALAFFMFEYFTRADTTGVTGLASPAPAATAQDSADAAGSASGQSVSPGIPLAAEIDQDPSIAVMPFVNMSSDRENEYFSDGLSEELLNVLAQVDGLRVAGRTSSFFYKGKNIDLRQIGEELDVEHILEGSVRKSGNQVRVTAQLISAKDGFHLWSDTFDRELNDIFAIQDEIAGEVAQAMQLALLDNDGQGVVVPGVERPMNAQAHDVYLQARQRLYSRSADGIRQAIDLFKLATTLDSEYGPAWVGYANAIMVGWNNHRVMDLDEALQLVDEALSKAEELEYTGAEYWASKGLSFYDRIGIESGAIEKAADAFEKAIELNPNDAQAMMWYANLIRTTDPVASNALSNSLMAQAVKIDPHSRVIQQNYYLNLIESGEIERGIEGIKRLRGQDPDYPGYSQYLAQIYLSRGRLSEAAHQVSQLPEDARFRYFFQFFLAYHFGIEDRLQMLLASMPGDIGTREVVRLAIVAESGNREAILREANRYLEAVDIQGDSIALGWGLLNVGEYELAIRLIENAVPALRGDALDPEEFARVAFGPMLPVALEAMYYGGQRERAKRYARGALAAMKGRPLTGWPVGSGPAVIYAHLVLEQYGEALAVLERGTKDGFVSFNQSGLDDSELAAPLRAMPRYQELRKIAEFNISAQRDAVFKELSWSPLFANAVAQAND